MTTRARRQTHPFLARGYAFHFPPWHWRLDPRAPRPAPDDPMTVCEEVLIACQRGDFGQFERVVATMKTCDWAMLWGAAAMLLSHAAPSSVLRGLLEDFAHEIFERKEPDTQQWIAEILLDSGLYWTVPEALRIMRAQVDREQNFGIPISLSNVIEPTRGIIFSGPPEIPEPGPWPDWFDPPFTYDDETYVDLVLARHRELGAQLADPARDALFLGAPLDLDVLARRALDRIAAGQDIEEIAQERTLLEAATGIDLSAMYRDFVLDPLPAAAAIEALFDAVDLEGFPPGERYFFGRRIPD